MSAAINPAAYLAALHPKATFEVCAIKGRDLIRVGNFNDPYKAEQAACEHDGTAQGLYATVNPINKWAGNPEHLRQGRRVSSNDIRRRAHLYLDIDSERPNKSNTNATEAEHAAALKRRDTVAEYIRAQGGPDPKIIGDSGNGGYVLYDLANNATDTSRAHRAICEKWSDATASLDPQVTDLARLHPLAGTIKAKGPSSTQRPQRRTTAEVNNNAGEMSAEFLAYLASMLTAAVFEPEPVKLVDYNGKDLPPAAIEFLTIPPEPGQRNQGLFRAARAMRDAGLPEQQAHATLIPAAIDIGFTSRGATGVIRSTYERQAPTVDKAATMAHVTAWRTAALQVGAGHQTRARLQRTRVAMALADIAERTHKTEIAASVRDVSIEATMPKAQTAKALNGLRREDKLIYCTNLRKRDTGDARTYKLTIPTEPRNERDTHRVGAAAPPPPSSMSVSFVTGLLHHEFVSTKTGSVVIQILQVLADNPTLEQLRKATGRRPDTLKKALDVMQGAGLIAGLEVDRRGNTSTAWHLTTTDPARILAVFDVLAIRFKAVGRREYLRRQYASERRMFRETDAEDKTAVVDELRKLATSKRKSSGIRAVSANMNARAQGKPHLDRVEL